MKLNNRIPNVSCIIHTLEKLKNKQNIGIALSGGGARGIAHIGVLQALHELSIFPSRVSGTSAGALIGSMYCKGMSPLEMLELLKDTTFSKIFRVGFTSKGINSHKYLQEFLLKNIGPIEFKELKIPLYVGVTNIDLGRFEVHRSGDLIPSVIASCSIPLIFKPVLIHGQSYVDGGVMNNLPVEPLLSSCDKVIGIGVHQHNYVDKVTGMRDIGIRTFQLAIWNTMEERMKKCDIALDVSAAGKFGMFELNRASELFDIGKEAVLAQSEAFRELAEGSWNQKLIFR